MDIFEAKHQQNMVRYAKQIDKIFFWVCQSAAHIGKSAAGGVAEFDTEMFQFSDYPKVQEQVDALLKKMHADIEATVFQGVEQEWSLANKKHDKLTKEVLGQRLAKMNQEQYKRYFNSNQAGLEAFKNRQISGLNLSDRVWKYTNGFKSEIEAALSLSLEQGKSAQKVAKELKQYLQEPNRLYRRVKDKYGNLVPSKAMTAYHPGAGVYRSSYMNARRLAVTETNIAFRTSDHLRIQDEDFVVGIRVVMSNNHTCKGVKGVYFDICDELQGDYPKDFKFTGWHPHCRCHTETILKTDEEMDADFDRILKGEELSNESINLVSHHEIKNGKNIYEDIDYIPTQDELKGRTLQHYFAEKQGYNGLPEMVSELDIDDIKVYRGVNAETEELAKKYVRDFESGELFSGRGGFGDGIYLAKDRGVAVGYAHQGKFGEVMDIGITPNMRIINSEELIKLKVQYQEKLGEDMRRAFKGDKSISADKLIAREQILNNDGLFATVLGYDGIYDPNFKYYAVFNRTKLKVINPMSTQQTKITAKKALSKNSINEVVDVPSNFTKWISNNTERAKAWENVPYFIRDNIKYAPNIEANIYSETEKILSRYKSVKKTINKIQNSYLATEHPELSIIEKAVVNLYTQAEHSVFRRLNKQLMNGTLDKFNNAFSSVLSKAIGKIEPIKEGTTIYRTIRLNKKKLSQLMNSVGDIETFQAFTSCSTDFDVVLELLKRKKMPHNNETDVILVIKSKKAHPINDFSDFGKMSDAGFEQMEVLINKNQKFYVEDMEQKNGRWYFYLSQK